MEKAELEGILLTSENIDLAIDDLVSLRREIEQLKNTEKSQGEKATTKGASVMGGDGFSALFSAFISAAVAGVVSLVAVSVTYYVEGRKSDAEFARIALSILSVEAEQQNETARAVAVRILAKTLPVQISETEQKRWLAQKPIVIGLLDDHAAAKSLVASILGHEGGEAGSSMTPIAQVPIREMYDRLSVPDGSQIEMQLEFEQSIDRAIEDAMEGIEDAMEGNEVQDSNTRR